jgi:hypothetical protein
MQGSLTAVWGNEEVERAAWHMARLYRAEQARHRTTIKVAAFLVVILTMVGVAASLAPHPVLLAVPMPGYGLPVCATEDSTPVGGCVWPSGDGTWINYPGRA